MNPSMCDGEQLFRLLRGHIMWCRARTFGGCTEFIVGIQRRNQKQDKVGVKRLGHQQVWNKGIKGLIYGKSCLVVLCSTPDQHSLSSLFNNSILNCFPVSGSLFPLCGGRGC